MAAFAVVVSLLSRVTACLWRFGPNLSQTQLLPSFLRLFLTFCRRAQKNVSVALLGLAPTAQDFARQIGLRFCDQPMLLWCEKPFLIVFDHLNPLLGIVDIVKKERVAVDAFLGRNLRWSIWDVTTNIDIKGVGFPVDDGHWESITW